MKKIKITTSEIYFIFHEIKKKFGLSRYKKGGYPNLRIIKKSASKKKNPYYGYYNSFTQPNEIVIYLDKHKTYRSICDTILHEYKHYLLSDCEYYKLETKLYKQGCKTENQVYNKHPHEKLAFKFAKRYSRTFLRKLMKFKSKEIK